MSCLLPQFKCSPDTFAAQFKSHGHFSLHAHAAKCKDLNNFRTQCVLSANSMQTVATPAIELEKLHLPLLEQIHNSVPAGRPWNASTSTTTAVLDLEKLNLSSLDARLFSNAADEPWKYMEVLGRLSEVNLEATLSAETRLMSEEAVIAAAASEALALATAAVKVAKQAAMMVSQEKSMDYRKQNTGIFHEVDKLMNKKSRPADLSARACLMESEVAEMDLSKIPPVSYFSRSEDAEPSVEELTFLEAQLSNGIAVRSKRQTERKAKRIRAAEKAAANAVPVKSGSTSRKKRLPVQEIDYSDPLRYFRVATSSSKLLTASEEQMLSKGIQDLLRLERIEVELGERCGSKPTLAQWAAAAGVDQKTLTKRLSHGTHCKDKMIKSNTRLVISIAKNYQGVGMNLQDLVQEGCRGLLRGCEKFDASKGFKFSTYAHWWIKQAVRRFLSDQSRTIRLPFHMVDAAYRVREARKQLYSENKRNPDDAEVAQAAGISMKRLTAVLLTPKTPRSLDQKIGINQDLKPSEMIADPEAETSDDLLIKQLMKEDLGTVLDSLNPREKQVIKWRFGLEDGRMKTLQEIGELMGVSRERIRQIESCGFRKLKNRKRTKHLQQYLMP